MCSWLECCCGGEAAYGHQKPCRGRAVHFFLTNSSRLQKGNPSKNCYAKSRCIISQQFQEFRLNIRKKLYLCIYTSKCNTAWIMYTCKAQESKNTRKREQTLKNSITITQLHNFIRFSNSIHDQRANIPSNIILFILNDISSKGEMKTGRNQLSSSLISGKSQPSVKTVPAIQFIKP